MGAAIKGPTINTEDYRHVSSIRDNGTDAERDSREKFIGHVLGKLPSLCILSMKARTERKEKERGRKEKEERRGQRGKRKREDEKRKKEEEREGENRVIATVVHVTANTSDK